MRSIIETLYDAQSLLRKDSTATEEQREATIKQLRETVPAPVLAHYLRIVTTGRNGIALVRNGVCCECHLRIPVSTIGSLLKPVDIHLCENCGCYLLLAPGEDAAAALAPKPAQKAGRSSRRKVASVS